MDAPSYATAARFVVPQERGSFEAVLAGDCYGHGDGECVLWAGSDQFFVYSVEADCASFGSAFWHLDHGTTNRQPDGASSCGDGGTATVNRADYNSGVG